MAWQILRVKTGNPLSKLAMRKSNCQIRLFKSRMMKANRKIFRYRRTAPYRHKMRWVEKLIQQISIPWRFVAVIGYKVLDRWLGENTGTGFIGRYRRFFHASGSGW